MSKAEDSATDRRASNQTQHKVGSDIPFRLAMLTFSVLYVGLLVGMLMADVVYLATSESNEASNSDAQSTNYVIQPFRVIGQALAKPEIQYSVKLTLISCFFTAVLSLLVAVPIGYLLSRSQFRGKGLVDAILDIPIVLPPLIIGLSLLILFQFSPLRYEFDLFGLLENKVSLHSLVVYKIPAVVLAQFMVSAAFAIRVMRATFDQIDTRVEKVALTLGCTQAQAFGMVVLPQSRSGMLTAGTLAWARALGEFGPLLIFAGATRMKTEVLSTSVFLELSIGNLESAVAVSLIMVFAAILVMVILRIGGTARVFSSHP